LPKTPTPPSLGVGNSMAIGSSTSTPSSCAEEQPFPWVARPMRLSRLKTALTL
jgi:hypothetical protein